MKKSDFPRIVRVGQTKATIYKTPSHGCDSFTVVWFEGSVRKRKAFASLDKAGLHAHSKVNSLSKGEAEIINLSGEDRLSYVRAQSVLSEFNLSLDTVAFEYRDAKRITKGISLIDAAQYYAQHKLKNTPVKSVSEVLAEMLKAKRDEGLSDRYLEDLENRLNRFARSFSCSLTSIEMIKIKEWLQELKVANRTRNNFRLAIQTLFSFAKLQNYLPKDWQEFESIPVWKLQNEQVEIFNPLEMKILLSTADCKLVPFLALGAFAGLRSAEISRLNWAKINLESGYITVDAGIAKTNSRRLVPIQTNLKSWLTPYVKPQGMVMELANIPNALQRLIEATCPKDHKNPKAKTKPAVEWRHTRIRGIELHERIARKFVDGLLACEPGETLLLKDAYDVFCRMIKQQSLEPVKRSEFSAMVVPLIRDQFNVALRNDLQIDERQGVRGWKDMKLLVQADPEWCWSWVEV